MRKHFRLLGVNKLWNIAEGWWGLEPASCHQMSWEHLIIFLRTFIRMRENEWKNGCCKTQTKTRNKWQTLDSQQPWFVVATGNMGLHYMFACRPRSSKSFGSNVLVTSGVAWHLQAVLCPSWLILRKQCQYLTRMMTILVLQVS